MQLIVLGMHRSGTSVLARMMNLMGVYFGPEGISTGANNENPKGFWERRDVRALNDHVLHSVGCDWNRVLKFDASDLPEKLVAEFETRASKLVLEMDAHRPWLLKEPRLSLLFPLWRRVFEVPICIQILRNPIEVASSLRTRNDIPMQAGLALWEKYVQSALQAMHGLPRIIVSHQQLMREPYVVARQLLQGLVDKGVSALRMPGENEVTAFVRDELYRERESRPDLIQYANSPQVAMFKRLLAGKALLPKQASLSPASAHALGEYESSLPPLKPKPIAAAVSQTEAELKRQLALREQEAKLVREMSEKLESELSLRTTQVTELREESNSLKRLLLESHAKAMAMQEEFLATHDRASIALQASIDHGVEQTGRIEALIAENMELQRTLDERERESLSHVSRLVSIREQLDVASKARIEAEARIKERYTEIAQLTRMLQEAETSVEQLRLEARQAERKSNKAIAELEQLRSDADARFSTAQKEVREAGRRWRDATLELGMVRDEARKSNESRNRQQAQLLEIITTMQASKSWRITKPIRWLSDILRFGSAQRWSTVTRDRGVILASGLFDDEWYLADNPDVRDSGMDPIVHYLLHGAAEGRDPSRNFSTRYYLEAYPTVAEEGSNPLMHYILHGRKECFRTNVSREASR